MVKKAYRKCPVKICEHGYIRQTTGDGPSLLYPSKNSGSECSRCGGSGKIEMSNLECLIENVDGG